MSPKFLIPRDYIQYEKENLAYSIAGRRESETYGRHAMKRFMEYCSTLEIYRKFPINPPKIGQADSCFHDFVYWEFSADIKNRVRLETEIYYPSRHGMFTTLAFF